MKLLAFQPFVCQTAGGQGVLLRECFIRSAAIASLLL